MKKSLALLTAACASAFAVNAQAATKWDLPSAYPASNRHTQNLEQFVKEVKELSGGELDITLHRNASLYKETAINRAVKGNQAQIGEILLPHYANDEPISATDGLPILPTDHEAAWNHYQAPKDLLDKQRASQVH